MRPKGFLGLRFSNLWSFIRVVLEEKIGGGSIDEKEKKEKKKGPNTPLSAIRDKNVVCNVCDESTCRWDLWTRPCK